MPPGLYRLRLHADDEVAETEVEVRVDPALRVGAGELSEQYRAVRRLLEWQDAIVVRLNAIEEALGQVEERRRAWKRREEPMPDDLAKALDEFERKARDLAYGRLARDPDLPSWGAPPRLLERIGSLASNLRGQFAAPTAAQRTEFEEVVRLASDAVSEADRFLDTEVPSVSRRLESHGLPAVRPYMPREGREAEGGRDDEGGRR